ncbi:hypothetical protein NDU88_000755 [Pleurodeles waltl]|uniref:Uncharacterized protein n=1 Tax=Pleurodeles waltl TaxID=8319 RepID=A0AAV7VZ41_PLEWA|nr:hypothetical protein NDU88_000755 [Pleurodeles waltl]
MALELNRVSRFGSIRPSSHTLGRDTQVHLLHNAKVLPIMLFAISEFPADYCTIKAILNNTCIFNYMQISI